MEVTISLVVREEPRPLPIKGRAEFRPRHPAGEELFLLRCPLHTEIGSIRRMSGNQSLPNRTLEICSPKHRRPLARTTGSSRSRVGRDEGFFQTAIPDRVSSPGAECGKSRSTGEFIERKSPTAEWPHADLSRSGKGRSNWRVQPEFSRREAKVGFQPTPRTGKVLKRRWLREKSVGAPPNAA